MGYEYTKASDLSVGDKIALVRYDHWSNHRTIQDAEVTKILKTRIDITTANGTVQRWVVDKWGEIRTRENDPDRYYSPSFFKADDERVTQARKSAERHSLQIQISNTISDFKKNDRFMTAATLSELVSSLSDLRDKLAATE